MKNRYCLSEDQLNCRVYFNDGSFFVIDTQDLPAVSQFTWFLGKRGYPVAHASRKSSTPNKTFPLHRYLMNPEDGYDIDHITGDKMDNRRSNLRVCTHQENMFNQTLKSSNKTGFCGVSKNRRTGTYEAYLHINGSKKYLGMYSSAEEAARVRDEAAMLYYGEYARLNMNCCEVINE